MPIELASELESLEGLPEAVPLADLFEEGEDGRFRLAPIKGLKPAAEFDKVMAALRKERTDHGATKGRWKALGDRDPDEVMAALDEVEELRLQVENNGKLDQKQIDELVAKRFDKVRAPLERQIQALATEKDELAKANGNLTVDLHRHLVSTRITSLATKDCNPDALADIETAAGLMLTVDDSGEVVTKDGLRDMPAGMTASEWLDDMKSKRVTWNKPTGGGGGGRGSAQTGGILKNPFSHDGWDRARQDEVARDKGIDEWKRLAAAAGVDPTRPARPAGPNGRA